MPSDAWPRDACVVGLDIGTTSTVAVVMRPTGEVLAAASRPSQLFSPAPGFAEADPGEWWDNACATLREAIALAAVQPSAICVTGMVPALIMLDAEGQPLRRSLQQNDARCARELEELGAEIDAAEFLARTGQGLTQQLIAPKLRWVARHEPHVFARATHILGSYDYLNFRLAGRVTVERNWALEAGFVDLGADAIAPDLAALTGLAQSTIPPLVAAHERIGAVTAEAGAATGLPVGATVFGGAADHIASALAAGLTDAGDVLLKFGGAGDVIAISERAEPDPRLFLDYHLVPGLYAPNGCMAASGSLLRWLAALIGGVSLAELDAEAAAVPAGAEGVRMLPYFLGEKTPIHDTRARGTITGLSLNHGRGHIWRAALEAIACGFRHHLDVLADRGRAAQRLYASDGGSRSDVWMQIVADVCGQPLSTLGDAYGSSVGAAWVAAVGLGLAEWADVGKARRLGKTFSPRPDKAKASDVVYADYRALYVALRPFFHRGARP
jgi:xylulokinase